MLAPGVVAREEAFGAVVYVPERDHFFALSEAPARALNGVEGRWSRALAEVGILRTEPATPQRPHYGESLIGYFDQLPVVREPLVVNCFATAHCPLRCRYCHADDLMQPYRDSESGEEPHQVAKMAATVPALVAVVTGGDPLTRPERTELLVKELATA